MSTGLTQRGKWQIFPRENLKVKRKILYFTHIFSVCCVLIIRSDVVSLQKQNLVQEPEKDQVVDQRLKGYSITYDVCSAMKAKEEEERAFLIYSACLSEQTLCVLFPRKCHTTPADGK